MKVGKCIAKEEGNERGRLNERWLTAQASQNKSRTFPGTRRIGPRGRCPRHLEAEELASLNIVPENFEPRPDPRRVWIPSHWTCPPQPLQASPPLVCCCIHSSDGHGSDSFGHVTCKRGGNWPRSKSWSLRAKEQYATLRAKHRCDEFISTFRYQCCRARTRDGGCGSPALELASRRSAGATATRPPLGARRSIPPPV